ncbi:predicted protein [Sclerotinia sclerotiorum 1980 UF-70]|uniref:RING-type domain-containing protein n=2 Tax=Sclerotinia sclerotiorum (strain ATCC 18683 / 1980 / Ss-1) TaxID=665079 RepID=A7ENK4_SCLS1|nr:predicted protein [Sclerotinia sclerotiorum 1980 UF-70]APA14852.1 hypothetical protein sscle_13g096220 [Sclerotinia sclerotiorum 1980 UF-70]EDO04420.1 predicted protein [Sclerotinia sclerotiorum 1980 UF-70]
MSNTENIDEFTRRLGDIRRRNRPNQRRNYNFIPSRGPPEAPQVPVASRTYTSASRSSRSSPFNPNPEYQSIHNRRRAIQAAFAVTGQMSLRRPPVVLGGRQPVAHHMHRNELDIASNEPPINDTSPARLEELQSQVNHLHIHIDQLQTRIYQLQISISELPALAEHMQASTNLFLIRINQLKARLEQLQDRIDDFPIRITQLQTHFSPFPSNLESVQARIHQFRVRVDHLNARIEKLQTRIDRMSSQLNQLQTRVEHLLQRALLIMQEETNAPRTIPNHRPTLFPDFPLPPVLGRDRLNSILTRYQNTALRVRKTAIENLLQSVDGAWENIDLCFCGDLYEHVTAAGESHAPAKMPKCGHVFGRPCIALWLKEKDTCPMCRDEVDLPVGERDYLRDL